MRNDTEKTPLNAQTIIVDAEAYEDELAAADDYNWYKFTATEAGDYVIGIYAEDSDEYDTYLYLYYDGILDDYTDIEFGSTEFDNTYYIVDSYLDADDDGGVGYNSRLTFTAEAGTTYYFLVTDYSYPDGYVFTYSVDVTTVEE